MFTTPFLPKARADHDASEETHTSEYTTEWGGRMLRTMGQEMKKDMLRKKERGWRRPGPSQRQCATRGKWRRKELTASKRHSHMIDQRVPTPN